MGRRKDEDPKRGITPKNTQPAIVRTHFAGKQIGQETRNLKRW
jgi:hypothetical protein